MAGIKEIKEAAIGGAKFKKAIDLARADGEINLKDIIYLIDPVIYLPTAIGGYSEIKAEIADLDETELTEIKTAVRTEIGNDDLSDEIVEMVIMLGLQIARLFLAENQPSIS